MVLVMLIMIKHKPLLLIVPCCGLSVIDPA